MTVKAHIGECWRFLVNYWLIFSLIFFYNLWIIWFESYMSHSLLIDFNLSFFNLKLSTQLIRYSSLFQNFIYFLGVNSTRLIKIQSTFGWLSIIIIFLVIFIFIYYCDLLFLYRYKLYILVNTCVSGERLRFYISEQ